MIINLIQVHVPGVTVWCSCSTHSDDLRGPAVLMVQDADGLLQCLLPLLHVAHLLVAVAPLLLDTGAWRKADAI